MRKTRPRSTTTDAAETSGLTRRGALALFASTGAGLIPGCDASAPASPTAAPAPASSASPATGGTPEGAVCVESPTETRGPFPSLSDFVRSDVTEGHPGTPLALMVRVVNAADGCAPVEGAAVSIWHVDAGGDYSQYGGQAGQTFLRGVQVTEVDGHAEFATIYPGWYRGRATHIHLEVSVGGRSLKVTQIAFPDEMSDRVHRSGVYAARGVNPTRNTTDSVFRDGVSDQLAELAGDPETALEATFQVGVDV